MKMAALIFFAAFLAASILFAQTSTSSKQPVPDIAAQRRAGMLCKELYGEEYANAKCDGDKQKLAAKLLAKARQCDGDLPMQFLMVRLARDVATQGHDGPTALDAVDALDEVFAIDAVEMKSTILTALASATKLPSRHKYIAQQFLKLMARTIGDDNYAAAAPLGKSALSEADEAHDRQFLAMAHDRVNEMSAAATEYEQVKPARLTLEKTPRDPAANLVVGRYLCLVKNRWKRGSAMLLSGNDESLKAVARLELFGAASTTELAALGDAWWDLAEQEQVPVKWQMQRRAGYWYQAAARGLTGVESDKVVRRLKAIAPLAAADAATRTLSRTTTAGSEGGEGFEDIPWGQCRLTGLRVTASAPAGAPEAAITSVQPIYCVGGDSMPTKIYGKESESAFRTVAKSGYAIGGIVSEGGDRLSGLQIVFMRVREGKLDRNDFYVSDWIGARRGQQQEIRLGCDGKCVVGVFGASGRELKRLGLVQLE
jgi:hypothetical protein